MEGSAELQGASLDEDEWDPRILFDHPLDTVPGALAELARRLPDKLAIDAGAEQLTFGQLARRANDVAMAVLASGAAANDPVALVLGSGADAVAAVLGVMSSARICVPFDGREPSDRLSVMLRASRATLVVTDEQHEQLASNAAPGVRLQLLDALSETDERCPIPEFGPDDPGLVLFTSGSTGVPKGVVLPYAPRIVQAVKWGFEEQMTPSDRVATLSSLSYVVGLLHVIVTLVTGATVCGYDVQHRGLRDLTAWMRSKGITMIGGVPSLFRALADVADNEPIASVRRVSLYGETVYGNDVHLARRLFGDHVVVDSQLGTTEAGGIAMHVVTPDMDPDDGPLPAGALWYGTSVEIVDDDGHLVPTGETGHLVAISETTTLGYWDDPALTAEFYLTTPDGRRGFRTSDLARFRPDGMLEHLGRADSRVKVRGAMVATSEVEGALAALDDVTEAAVVALPTPDGGNRLVAYVAARRGTAPSASHLRREVARLVPSTMVPPTVVVLDALPHGARGKINRTALPPPPPHRPYVAPHGDEGKIAALFGEVLGLDRVGRDDDFFELGGDSLSALELVAAIAERWGVDLPASTLLDAPTPAQLGARLRRPRARPASIVVPLVTGGPCAPFYCAVGGGALAMSLRRLADAIGDDRPFFALQAHGLEERALPDRSIPAMARRNVGALREIDPDGPYLLGGFSFGGQVAYEMATRLSTLGARVVLLVLLDAPPSWSAPSTPARALHAIKTRRGIVRSAGRTVSRQLAFATAGIVPRRGLAQHRLFRDFHASMARNYRPTCTFGGPALVVRFPEPDTGPHDLGWSEWVTGPITVIQVPGDHRGALRPPTVDDLGLRLREALAEVS